MEEEAKPEYNTRGKGGFEATYFIYGMVALENIGCVGNIVSLVLYLRIDLPGAANTLPNLMVSALLLSVVGGFISDTYINRFHTCLIFGMVEISALLMMTAQAHDEELQSASCDKFFCMTRRSAIMFSTSLWLWALGSGGVKGSLPALGADQFDQKDPEEAKGLASYFNWLLLSMLTGTLVGATVIVYISTIEGSHKWWKGFLITFVCAYVGFIIFAHGKPFYRLQVPGKNPLVRIAQVIVVAIKNRKLPPPESPSELYEINERESASTDTKIAHTEQFRSFDKAAILPKDAEPLPWTVCTVTQVEEVKVLTRMLPIIASTIMMNICLAQLKIFSVQQGYTMDRKLGSLEVLAPFVPLIPLIFKIILIPIYEFTFVPFARKITKHPSGITQLQRVGVGLVLSALSMAVAALVEVKREHQSLKNPLKPISLFWLSFQYGIFEIADMLTLVGLLEFFYKEAPSGMRSLSTSFTWISLSFGSYLSIIFVETINAVTESITPSKQGWLEGQILDQKNLNLFYWFLAILSVLNFFNYLYWATWYKYKKEDTNVSTMAKLISISGVSLLETAEDESRATNGEYTTEHTEVNDRKV
ncbi:protein NRT1/ PTR FAMILY 4.6-like [Olea europaea var. sylvestris]|uniref:NRT1 PTR FAMILY -like isoform X2 n=1 Tax=Olea europaea subsp. europaea TaxID=158383 RepID=A0A8S0VAR7_OLEEU|nr:protein NRT1/ PTR FAMILY 4.6-like [Olea europaea var. sylvestris]CAA3027383.1 NRT1 PTR FAMILY -like isoform X2 [Olea europaea subsp. europaea]